MKKLNNTRSICRVCQKIIPAAVFEKGGEVLIRSRCPEHGETVGEHLWNDPQIYQALAKTEPIKSRPGKIVLILTNRCNSHCSICFASSGEGDMPDLSIKNLDQAETYPIVYLSGGEPTIREDLVKIVRILSKRNKQIILFTNGRKLADWKYAARLKKNGVKQVIFQLDCIDERFNEKYRGKGSLAIKKTALKNMRGLRINTNLCAVLTKDNLPNLKDFLNYALEQEFVRTITTNALKKIGRFSEKDYVPPARVVEHVNEILKIKKSDWIQSSKFLINLDKLFSIIGNQKRIYNKCYLKCFVFKYNEQVVPLGKVFNLVKINAIIEKNYPQKPKKTLFTLLGQLIIFELLFNFLTNHFFRKFCYQLLKNLKYWLPGDTQLLSPFRCLAVTPYFEENNVDLGFVKSCSCYGVMPGIKQVRPACLQRHDWNS